MQLMSALSEHLSLPDIPKVSSPSMKLNSALYISFLPSTCLKLIPVKTLIYDRLYQTFVEIPIENGYQSP